MKVNFDFESYRSMFTGGARSYLFFVPFNFPDGTPTSDNAMTTFGLDKNSRMFPYLVKSTSLPDTSFEEVAVTYGPLVYKQAGMKTYSDWQVTMNVDERGLVLDKFHSWQNKIYNPKNEYGKFGLPKYYMKNQEIYLLDNSGNTIKKYILHHCWPKSIGDTSLDYSSSEIATFTVTFSYLYFEVGGSTTTTSAINGFIKKAFETLIG